MQRLICLILLLACCLLICDAQLYVASTRNSVTVYYEYQLEVNNDNDFNTDNGTTISTEQAVGSIDSTILETLQQMLPHGGMTATNPTVPNVQFSEVTSEIFSACFTESDQCSLVRTFLVITYEGEKPEYSLEAVAYRLAQDYLDDINSRSNRRVIVTYMYPFFVSSMAKFQFTSVEESMRAKEIEVMEESILEVFGAIVAAIEGDTEISDATFIYQDLQQDSNSSDWNISADFIIHGICRECSDVEFVGMVNAVIETNLDNYENRLKANGDLSNTTYFSSVDEIIFAVPTAPNGLPPVDDESIYDSQAPTSNDALPVVFYVGISMFVCVLCSGMYMICKDLGDLEYEKDDDSSDVFSTESESNGNSSDAESQIDRLGMEEYEVTSDEGPIFK